MRAVLEAQQSITPGGQRQPSPQRMRSVYAVSFGSQRGLLIVPPSAPTEPLPGPLCVDPAPCGLAALWPFTCDCVQSPAHPPLDLEPHLQIQLLQDTGTWGYQTFVLKKIKDLSAIHRYSYV